jgi:membrane-associated protein
MGSIPPVMNVFTLWLIAHESIAYLVLFLGAYFETLVGVSFFIPGEIFFLSGSILAGAHILNIFYIIPIFYIGAALGDSSSFFIGLRFGAGVFRKDRKILSSENFEKGERFFKKYGAKAVFFARLLGPLSWITPFLAGTYKLKYKEFLKYNIPGVLAGVGQFIIVGYFFGSQIGVILPLFERYIWIVIISVITILFLIRRIKRFREIV